VWFALTDEGGRALLSILDNTHASSSDFPPSFSFSKFVERVDAKQFVVFSFVFKNFFVEIV
jgi:hypothetical protein